MANDLTVGDDYIAPCPHCYVKMNIGFMLKEDNLHPGFVGTCGKCGKQFEIDHIDYIPNVWLRKHASDYQANASSAGDSNDVQVSSPGHS